MGATNKTLDKNFYSIKDNRFRRIVREKTDTTKEFTGSNGKVYYYEEYTLISGFLRKIWTFQEEKEGSQPYTLMVIDLKDESGQYECIQMYFDSNAASSFLKRLPNINLALPVEIKIGKQTREGSDKSYDRLDVYNVYPDGTRKLAEYHWGKDKNPLVKLPEWKKIVTGKGKNEKTIWDKSEQLEFFENMIKFKSAEIINITKALNDGLSFEEIELAKQEGEYGKVLLNWTKKTNEESLFNDSDNSII